MFGADIAVGYLAAWAVAKARRIGAPVDAEVNRGLDDLGIRAAKRLREVIAAQLGTDPALIALEQESISGTPSERTIRRVRDSLDEALERDPFFAEQVNELLSQLTTQGPVPTIIASATGHAQMPVLGSGVQWNNNYGGGREHI